MADWTNAELKKIGTAEELQISWLRGDGTLHSAVTIWVVRVGDDLYVRSVRGRDSIWFRGTQLRHEGRIAAGGVGKDVAFIDAVDAGAEVSQQIDDAYRTKYRRYDADIVNSTLTPAARSATLKLMPR